MEPKCSDSLPYVADDVYYYSAATKHYPVSISAVRICFRSAPIMASPV